MFFVGSLVPALPNVLETARFDFTRLRNWRAVRWELVEVGWIPDATTPPTDAGMVTLGAGGQYSD